MVSDGVISSTPGAFRLRWDVFLSFRGTDTRHSFTMNLYQSLQSRGVRVFRDDDGLDRGDEIAPSLLEAIDDSAASIVILSPNYASSHWCLEELTKICDCRRLILPVFYMVDPSHVRHQKGPFEEAFRAHEERFGSDMVHPWREAMKKVGGVSGLVFQDGEEAVLIKLLVKRVLKELSNTPVGVAEYTVGLDNRVKEVMEMLDVKSNGVRVLGLYGTGGVGKTTLVKTLFNILVGRFEHRAFLSNVREVSSRNDDLLSLQNNIIAGLGSSTVNDINVGISRIKSIVHENPVLIVLDDIDDVKQIDSLIGKREWYCDGSRIIITTRDQQVLAEHHANLLYEVKELNSSDALELFSYHALRRKEPSDSFLNLSKQIVSLTGGLPLALEVFGSFLFDKRRVEEWEDAVKKLTQIRPRHLQDVLRISFDGLDEQEKCVFLDIACLFVQMKMQRDYAIDVLRSFGFRGEIAITVLTEKCLIKITPENTLAMHDQIRDMGRQIVLEENLVDPAMRSRLWNRSEIMAVLKNDTGTRCIQGIVLDFERKTLVEDIEKDKEVLLPTKSFEPMVKLRLLQINNLRLEGKFKFLPAQLKCLQWQKCPLEFMPSDFYPRELAILDLSYSHKIKNLWGRKSYKVPENLLVMNLSYCVNLAAVPDLSACQHLEKIDLVGCTSIVKIHESIGNLIELRHLNLSNCSNLIELPSDIYGLKHLENLFLSGCSKLAALPKNIGCMKSLRRLLLVETAIAELPESIFHLKKLEKLILDGCLNFRRLPHCIGHLCSMQELSLNRSALEELPDSIGRLGDLEKLSLMQCGYLTSIPEAIGKLTSLTKLQVDRSAITELPPSIGQLSYLGELSVENCKSLSKLPYSIGALASIVVLQLNGTTITNLPDQIGAMKTLRKLDMRDCIHLKSLPESIGSLAGLTSLNLLNSNIRELPDSIGLLENLVTLKLNKSRMLRRLPPSIGNLKSLCRFLMEETALTELPESFGMLSRLTILKMAKKPADDEVLSSQEKLNSFVLPSSFCNLTLLNYFDASSWRISGKIPDDFEKLSSLETLNLGGNKFQSLPSSLKGLSILKKLLLRNCTELTSLPSLPSSLIELDAQNCTALESISDLSNLENLQMLNLTNCANVEDIPGLEIFKSLKGLYMSGCSACTLRITRRLSKVSVRKLLNLSMPGSRLPEWFLGQTLSFSKHKSRELKGVIIGCIVSINHSIPCETRNHFPTIVDVRVSVLKMGRSVYNGSLRLHGVPRTNEEHIHLCRYLDRDPLFLYLRDGDTVSVSKQNPPLDNGLELRKCGVHLIYEGEDDYEGDEESVDESLQSVSEKLVKFFNSGEEQKSAHSTNNRSFLFLSGVGFGIIAIIAFLCRAKEKRSHSNAT